MNSFGISKVIPIVLVVTIGDIIALLLLFSADPMTYTPLPASDRPEPAPGMTFTLTGLNTRWTRNAVENPTLQVPLGSVVQVVLENDGPVAHQFAIDDFDIL